jgi:Na+/alanine symporter
VGEGEAGCAAALDVGGELYRVGAVLWVQVMAIVHVTKDTTGQDHARIHVFP